MATKRNEKTINGIELDVLRRTISDIEQDPELGRCTFRASNRWMGGDRNHTTITSFHAAKQEMTHAQKFELDADEPALLAGDDTAANPVEHLLNALAGCVTTSMVAHAAIRGIHIEELESSVEGDIDLRGFLGLSSTVPKGYTNIRATFRVKADEPDMEKLRSLTEFSPVFNTIANGAAVEVTVKPK